MIVNKQRRQSHSNYQHPQTNNYTYSPFLQDKQNLFKTNNKQTTFLVDKQTAYKRQRNSVGSLSKLNRNTNYNSYEQSKKSQKKYDYSAIFQQANQRQSLNKTHNKFKHSINKIESNNRNSANKRQIQQEKSYLAEQFDRKRASSVKNSIHQKYKYTDNYLLAQQIISEIPKYQTKPLTSEQKNHQNPFFRSQNPKYQSTQVQNQNSTLTSNNEKRHTNTKSFFGHDNNLDLTEKFLDFQTQQKLTQQKSNNKYEPKYSRIRNNKRSQIINKTHQYLQEQTLQQLQENKNEKILMQINFEQLYKNSQTDNKKITQKIHRITELNSEINRKLQKMLMNKNVY